MFCRERGIDPILTSLDQLIEFLIEIFESGVGYSSVGTARSALSSFPIMDLMLTFPTQFAVWDPDIILDCLNDLEYDLPLKDLSEKLVILLCLLFRQRDQPVKALNIKHMLLEKYRSTFFNKIPMKTTKPGFHQSPIVLSEYL